MQAPRASGAVFFAASLGMVIVGCQHAAARGGVEIADRLPSITAEELFQVALLRARQGDLLRAEQYLTAARSQGYDERETVYWLVRVCIAAGRYHSALGHAARHLRDDPANWRLRFVVASLHEALGEDDEARAELEHIVVAEPTSPLPRYRLAMLYGQRRGEMGNAIPHLEAYLALDPAGSHAAEVAALLAETRDGVGIARDESSLSAGDGAVQR